MPLTSRGGGRTGDAPVTPFMVSVAGHGHPTRKEWGREPFLMNTTGTYSCC